jgi:hypothetical protein
MLARHSVGVTAALVGQIWTDLLNAAAGLCQSCIRTIDESNMPILKMAKALLLLLWLAALVNLVMPFAQPLRARQHHPLGLCAGDTNVQPLPARVAKAGWNACKC